MTSFEKECEFLYNLVFVNSTEVPNKLQCATASEKQALCEVLHNVQLFSTDIAACTLNKINDIKNKLVVDKRLTSNHCTVIQRVLATVFLHVAGIEIILMLSGCDDDNNEGDKTGTV